MGAKGERLAMAVDGDDCLIDQESEVGRSEDDLERRISCHVRRLLKRRQLPSLVLEARSGMWRHCSS